MMKAAAPRVGGDRMAPIPAAARMPPPCLLRVAGLAQQRPGDAAEGHGGGDAGAGHRAQQEAGQGHGPAGTRLRLPESGERQVDEELGGARGAQHRAVDREQNDVGRRDVGGNPEQPLRAHDVVADEPDPLEGRRVNGAGTKDPKYAHR